MKFNWIKELITVPLAGLILLLSANAITLSTVSLDSINNEDYCFDKNDLDEESTFPDLFELEEEEQLIVHNKRMGLIKVSAQGVLNIFQFGDHAQKESSHVGDPKSPPPRS